MALKLFSVGEWGTKVINRLNTLTAAVNALAAGNPAGTFTAGNGIDINGLNEVSTAPVGSRLIKTSAQSISAGVPTIISWQDTEYDYGGGADASNNRYIIQGDGFYKLVCDAALDVGAVGTFEILVGGIYLKYAGSTVFHHLLKGDVITVELTASGNDTILVSGTYFYVQKVG